MALAVARRISFPLLVVKADAEGRVNAAMSAMRTVQDAKTAGRNVGSVLRSFAPREGPGFRVMVGVDVGTAGIEMLGFVGMLLRSQYDHLVLARCAQVDVQGEGATARFIDSYAVRSARRPPRLGTREEATFFCLSLLRSLSPGGRRGGRGLMTRAGTRVLRRQDAAHNKAPGFVPTKRVIQEGKGALGLVDGAAKEGCDLLVHLARPRPLPPPRDALARDPFPASPLLLCLRRGRSLSSHR